MAKNNFCITRNSRSRGQLLILLGLLFLAIPVILKFIHVVQYPVVELALPVLALVLFVLGLWRISQKIDYRFSVGQGVVTQNYSTKPSCNFSVNIREIKEIAKAPGTGNKYHLLLSSGRRLLIPDVMNSKPEKIARHINKLIGV